MSNVAVAGQRVVLLDNEAVQALIEPEHPKHRAVLAHLDGVARRRAKAARIDVAVPTTVRVEAGWDRSAPRAATINRFPVRDLALDGSTADRAAAVVRAAGVSVADAHVGVSARTLAETAQVVVLTSDPQDVARASAPARITTVRL